MPWLYNTHTGDVEHQNAAEWAADQALFGLAGGFLSTGLVDLNIPDNSTSAQAVAAAQKYVAAHGGTTPTTSSSQANSNAVNYATGGISDAAHVAREFYDELTNPHLWESIGWVVLGIVLVVLGLVLWIGPGAVKASPYGQALSAIRGARS